jgi:uncharacterized protein YfaP (DUF2135 family)
MTVVLIALLGMACNQEGITQPDPLPPLAPAPAAAPPPAQPTYTVSSFVSGVSASDGSSGIMRTGTAPQPSGGPAVQPTSNNSVINGGSTQVRLRSTTAFQTVYVFVGGVTGNVGGYWELRLLGPTSDTTLVVTQSRSIPVGRFDAVYAVAASSGAVGAYSAIQTQVLAAGTGEVQVSASWDARSDVDLHVVDPRGEEIYYGRTSSSSGGQLDLDSNAACTIDNKNNEIIRWPTGRAPSGTYTVRLDYWSSCQVASTSYVVTVNNGGNTQTFRGTFTGPGDQGGVGSGRTITTFTRAGTLQAIEDVLSSWLIPPSRLSPSASEKLRIASERGHTSCRGDRGLAPVLVVCHMLGLQHTVRRLPSSTDPSDSREGAEHRERSAGLSANRRNCQGPPGEQERRR